MRGVSAQWMNQNDITLLIFAAAYRLCICLCLCTSFVPDEYYQYVEPSHAVVYGKGFMTWEWDPSYRIRSYVPLLPMMAIYNVMKVMDLDTVENLHIAPRLLFTLLAILADYHMLRVAKYVLPKVVPPTIGRKSNNGSKKGTPTSSSETSIPDSTVDRLTAADVEEEGRLDLSRDASQLVFALVRRYGVNKNTAQLFARGYYWRCFGETLTPAQWVLVVHVLSWSLSYSLGRSLANSLETCALIIGVSLCLQAGRGQLFQSNGPITADCATATSSSSRAVVASTPSSTSSSSSSTSSAAAAAAISSSSSSSSRWSIFLFGEAHEEDYSVYSSAALGLAAASMYVRPTSAILWVPILWKIFISSTKSTRQFVWWACNFLTTFEAVGVTCIAIDTYFYQQLTVPPLNFFYFNLTKNFAAVFGEKPIYWNVFCGLPVMLGGYLPIFLWGTATIKCPRDMRYLIRISMWYPLVLSVVTTHQEHRFLLAALPGFHLLVGATIHKYWQADGWNEYEKCSCYRDSSNRLDNDTDAPSINDNNNNNNNNNNAGSTKTHTRPSTSMQTILFRTIIKLLLLFQLGAVIYLIRYHQAGPERAFQFIVNDIRFRQPRTNYDVGHIDVVVAAPCYSFPGYAHLPHPHPEMNSFAPKVSNSTAPTTSRIKEFGQQEGLGDTAAQIKILSPVCYFNMTTEDKFDSDPLASTSNLMKQITNDTLLDIEYLVTFDTYYPKLAELLKSHRFRLVANISHAYFDYDSDDDAPPKRRCLLYNRQKVVTGVQMDITGSKRIRIPPRETP